MIDFEPASTGFRARSSRLGSSLVIVTCKPPSGADSANLMLVNISRFRPTVTGSGARKPGAASTLAPVRAEIISRFRNRYCISHLAYRIGAAKLIHSGKAPPIAGTDNHVMLSVTNVFTVGVV